MSDDGFVVYEGAGSERAVVVDVVVERLTDQVETVQVVQAFDVCGETAAVLRIDLDLCWRETCFFGIFDGNSDSAV